MDWLALYQTGAFEEDRWAVRYVARVLGYELCKRIELLHDEPEHPDAQEPYFKVQLGPLQRLDKKIEFGEWKRFTFLYTTGGRVARATSLKDLSLTRPPEQGPFWGK